MAQTSSLREDLQKMEHRFSELEIKIQDPDVMKNNALYSRYLKEHGMLTRMVTAYREWKKIESDITEVTAMQETESDPEMIEMAREELEELRKQGQKAYELIQEMLIADEETDQKNAIFEIRAGTGGDEASLFANELYQMYLRYSEQHHWKVEILDSSPTDLGGFKEVVFAIKGKNVYKAFKYESGGHRVQRIPTTESGGRIHTSACTVAVLPEAEAVELDINPKDLRIDALRASGPGGQNVNKTSSAIRITHIPTGIVVNCQDTPEQYKNKMKAMRILRTRLMQKFQNEEHEKRNNLRRSQQGSGDRNDRVRTYNYPQNRVTDHRINLSIYNLEAVMQGNLEDFIAGLQKQDRERLLRELQGS